MPRNANAEFEAIFYSADQGMTRSRAKARRVVAAACLWQLQMQRAGKCNSATHARGPPRRRPTGSQKAGSESRALPIGRAISGLVSSSAAHVKCRAAPSVGSMLIMHLVYGELGPSLGAPACYETFNIAHLPLQAQGDANTRRSYCGNRPYLHPVSELGLNV